MSVRHTVPWEIGVKVNQSKRIDKRDRPSCIVLVPAKATNKYVYLVPKSVDSNLYNACRSCLLILYCFILRGACELLLLCDLFLCVDVLTHDTTAYIITY